VHLANGRDVVGFDALGDHLRGAVFVWGVADGRLAEEWIALGIP